MWCLNSYIMGYFIFMLISDLSGQKAHTKGVTSNKLFFQALPNWETSGFTMLEHLPGPRGNLLVRVTLADGVLCQVQVNAVQKLPGG